MTSRRVRRWSVPVLLVLVLGGCGVPHTSDPLVVTTVPYDLMSSAPAPSPQPTATAEDRPFVYLTTADERLIPLEVGASGTGTMDRLSAVLDRLNSGPTEAERASGWSTALGPEDSVDLQSFEGGLATIDLRLGGQSPSAGRLPLAVGQVVLSATSVTGVSSVALSDGSAAIEAPLPGGAQVTRSLTASDYTELLSSATTTAAPS